MILLLILLQSFVTGCTGVPLQEHYMLRSEFYRELEAERKLAETEKAVLRERMAGVESERARQEGRVLALERENETLRENAVELVNTRRTLDATLAEAERAAGVSRQDMDNLQVEIDRMKLELEAVRYELVRERASRETSIVVFDDLLFAPGARGLSAEQVQRIRIAEEKLKSSAHITVAGHSDNKERGHGIELSAARAAAVVKVLREMLGVSGDHFTVIARGEDVPRDASGTKEALAANRRVEVVAIFRP